MLASAIVFLFFFFLLSFLLA
uniref:Uncharacterized protein n=1 Tax=Rhizophora mucronata TaxID=61149 RepID=A0A2P2L3A7_RHIMU